MNDIGIILEIYDYSFRLKSFYQTGSGNFIDCDFVIDESGSRNFTLRFNGYVNINKKDFVKIKLSRNTDALFLGVVRTIPIRGTTDLNYEYTGFGFTDYLSRINTEDSTYTNMKVSEIVQDLLDTIITVKSPIMGGTLLISDIDIYIEQIEFKFISVKEALEQLKNIANSDGNEYIFGVNAEGQFFFQPKSTDVQCTLTVGKFGDFSIPNYTPSDSYEACSILHVLKDDGTYYKTYYSLENIDIYEKKVSAPQIAETDIDNWAEGQLKILEQEQRQASISWAIEQSNPLNLIADGTIRITHLIPPESNILQGNPYGSGIYGSGIYGGEQSNYYVIDDTLSIKEVAYKITKNEAIRNIQLGALPISLDREIIAVDKKIEELKNSLGY